MGRKEDSKSAINALYKHSVVIDEACYVARGQIEETPENDSLINSLMKNRLAYHLDDSLGVQLHSKVRGLLDHVTSRHRFREKHGAFAGLIEELENSIENYRQSRSRSLSSTDRQFDEIRETVMEIMDTLTDTVNMFHHVIGDEFSVVSDIDDRIRQTTRCKNEIGKLNHLFSELSVEKMRAWVQSNLQLERLLLKVLKAHVDKCLKDLAASNRKLVKMLDKLKKDKSTRRLNSLIDSFHRKYQEDLGYRPDISSLIEIPDCFLLTSEQTLGGYADLDSAKDEDVLESLALSALKKSNDLITTPQIMEAEEKVIDARGEVVEEKIDPLIENVEFFYEALFELEESDTLSAMDAYNALQVTASSEDWLLMINSYFEAQRKNILKYAKHEEVRDIELPFDGTLYVSDIVFTRALNEAR